ncbi:alpha-hydroxy acid oxidase [Mesorhizobium sp. 1B3]|uniref:alpha-hydroxy acid oxidase n=1 Tax=Mesorhizobium sp. 1B3 TaxID=3243599 RepID=UPI003D969CBA
MRRLKNVVNVDEVRLAARRYLPGFLYDFIEGGVDGEEGLARNESAFSQHSLMPRYLIDVSRRNTATKLFGRSYAMPFGISPTGPAALFRPDADLLLARAAADANVPFILSGAAGAALEDIHAVAPGRNWFQLYTARERQISHDQIRRAADVGMDVLVVTVDTPVTPKRERHLRNRISVPFEITPGIVLRMTRELLMHPTWFARFFASGGMPAMANWTAYMSAGASAAESATFFFNQAFVPGDVGTPSWRDLETYRNLWKGTLVVKGFLHPDDAVRAADIGCDGLIVSNHGGKALDRAPASLDALPAIKKAVGGRMTLMLDSGVRRGSDVVIALCLGADFVFAGRPTLYGVAIGGQAGAKKVLDIIAHEIDLIMATIGCDSTDRLDEHFLTEETKR